MEHIGAIALIALVVAGLGTVLVRAGLPRAASDAVGRVLGGRPEPAAAPAPRLRPDTYVAALAAVRGDAGAYSLAGARALLAEDLGATVGAAALELLVLRDAQRRFPTWFEAASAPVLRVRSPLRVHARSTVGGDVAVHVVTPAEEADAGAPGARGGWSAVALSLGQDALGLAMQRLGAAASAGFDALGLLATARPQGRGRLAAGERAGDVVLCTRYVLYLREGTEPERVAFDGVRLAVIRDGRLARDDLAETPSCG